MTERAAHLVDAVLPWVPLRQWVLTVPYRLRYQMAWNHGLSRAVLQVYSSFDPRGGRRCTLWQRLLGRPASESGTLRHGDGTHGRSDRCRRSFVLPILPERALHLPRVWLPVQRSRVRDAHPGS
jgi:hypothetical protein